MKTVLFSTISLIVLGSCSSYRPASVEPDDRYFSLADARKEQRQLKKLKDETAQETAAPVSNYKQYQDDTPDSEQPTNTGQSTVINNYYDMDDYYDYMYASRLRRFHRPYNTFSYYSPYYTNMYWYNYDPFFFGTSIYTTYSFFNPYVPWGYNHWTPGWNFGWNSWSGFHINYGWGFYNPWGWNNFGFFPNYSPFYYNPWACHPYGFGMGAWNNGFMYGYNSALFHQNYAFNQMYYNSYDQNSFVAPVVNKPYSGGFGAGANMIKTAPTLNQTLSKEIGSAPISQVKNPAAVKPGADVKSIQQYTPGAGAQVSAPPGAKPTSTQVKAGEVKAVQQVTVPGNSGKENSGQVKSQADRYNSAKSVNQVKVNDDFKMDGNNPQSDQQKNGVRNTNVTTGAADQKGKDGLIRSGVPQAGQYNSIPSQGNVVNRESNVNRPAANQDIRSSSPGGAQPYKPSYDYNRTLPAGRETQPQIRQQLPNTPTNSERQSEIRQNQGQRDIQNRNYQQAPQTRPVERIQNTPRNNPPVNREPSREYNNRQPIRQQQPVRPAQPEINRNNRYQNPQREQRMQPQNQPIRPSNPGRTIDRAPSNKGNIGGGRSNQGGGGQIQRTAPIRR